jgi:hypothetical protein
MTFGKALHALIKGKAKTISSEEAGFRQDIDSIKHWFFEGTRKEGKKNFDNFVKATDWVVDKGESSFD